MLSDCGAQTLIDQWDTNHDGQIDYPEFLAMMRANNEVLSSGAAACSARH